MRRFAHGVIAGGTLLAAPVAPQKLVTVRGDQRAATYAKRLFGQFAEHMGTGVYGGIWVGKGSSVPNINGYRRAVIDAHNRFDAPDMVGPAPSAGARVDSAAVGVTLQPKPRVMLAPRSA